MADAASGAKAAFGAFKTHWGWFLIGAAVLVIAALAYDAKNSNSLTNRVASWPIVGKLFA